MAEEKTNPLAQIVADYGGEIPSPQQVVEREADKRRFDSVVVAVDDVGDYKPEEEDENVLIYGPWLERGGSAFWVSTSGTGKSTSCMQLVHCMSAGLPFCGLKPRGKLRFWVFQSEDSPRRVAQDRIDVRAELAAQYPDIDWRAVGRTVKFVELTGAVGVKFLDELDRMLDDAQKFHEKPDVIVLNPFLAFVGGPVTDGAYVTPFLRGGEIGKRETEGLQALLKRHKVGVLVYHHTPKPPTDKELDGWMKSQFPEYQGAGSSDITNWGRSFITMMRAKGHANVVCCTAGKNGSELGWERIGGAYRRYMAFSDEIGVSGKARHAWRELTDEERDEIVGKQKSDDEKKCDDTTDKIAAALKSKAMTKGEIQERFAGKFPRAQIRSAIVALFAAPQKYGLTVKPVLRGRGWLQYIGQAEGLRKAVGDGETERKYAEAMEAQRVAETPGKAGNEPNVEAVEPTVDPQDAQSPEETRQEDDNGWF